MGPDLAAAAACATRLLLRQRLFTLRLDVARLRYDRAIIFDSMLHFCRVTRLTMDELEEDTGCLRDGCTLIRPGEPPTCLVLYRETRHRWRRNFTLAHEVGHIYLGHQSDGDIQEREANAFAAQLLLPEVLVCELARQTQGPLFPEELAGVFGASRRAAQVRMDLLRHKGAPAFTPADRQLLQKFRHLLP